MPGPGFTAALTATSAVGDGDSHRGAVATALVESLRQPSAADADLSVKATKGTEFPSSDAQWAKLFEARENRRSPEGGGGPTERAGASDTLTGCRCRP